MKWDKRNIVEYLREVLRLLKGNTAPRLVHHNVYTLKVQSDTYQTNSSF